MTSTSSATDVILSTTSSVTDVILNTISSVTDVILNTTSVPMEAPTTDGYYDDEANNRIWFYLVGVVGTVVGCVGLVSNSLALGVLLTKEIRNSSSSQYLINLAVYDWIFLLLTTVFSSVEYLYNGITDKTDWFFLYVSPSSPVIDSIMNVVLSGATYTTAILTIDRAISVSLPFQWSHISTIRRVRGALVIVLMWSAVINLPPMFEMYIGWKPEYYGNGSVLTAIESDYADSHFNTQVYLTYLAPIFGSGIPVFLIATANVVIVVTLKRRSRTASSLGNEERRRERMNREAKMITLQVVIVSLFTLVSHVLKVATYIIMDFQGTLYVNQCPLFCASISAVSQTWSLINASINLLFYCIFGQRFRRCFVQKYRCRKPGQRVTVHTSSAPTHHNNLEFRNSSNHSNSSGSTSDSSIRTISYNSSSRHSSL